MNNDELIISLSPNFQQYGFQREDNIEVGGINYRSVFITPDNGLYRYICSVIDVPKSVVDLSNFKNFFTQARIGLRDKYSSWVWRKKLGIIFCFLCNEQLLYEIRGNESMFRSIIASFSRKDSVLGSFFINKNDYNFSYTKTWGLFSSNKYFEIVSSTLDSLSKNPK